MLTKGHCYLMALETMRGVMVSTEEGGRGGTGNFYVATEVGA